MLNFNQLYFINYSFKKLERKSQMEFYLQYETLIPKEKEYFSVSSNQKIIYKWIYYKKAKLIQ